MCLLAAPSVSQVFSMELEVNPVHVEADLAAKLNIQPVEIVYDEVRTYSASSNQELLELLS